MKYQEINKDLFELKDEEYYFVHCISKDFALGAGIAVLFEKKYQLKQELFKIKKDDRTFPDCILVKNVFNLVTKEYCWGKPKLKTLRETLIMLKSEVIKRNIKKIAMPKIGSGLDRLSWNLVSEEIQDIFKDLDIEIIVCYI